MSPVSEARTAGLTAGREQAQARWQALAPRERWLVLAAVAAIALLLLWLVALQPAWRTLQRAPAQLDVLDAQLQTMQRLAAEARDLRAAPPVNAEQALAALTSAIERLGEKAKLTQQGDRVVVTLDNVSTALLREWLQDMRSAARARPIEVTLNRSPQGFSGTLVLILPAPPAQGAAR